jgi:hypothetical protein
MARSAFVGIVISLFYILFSSKEMKKALSFLLKVFFVVFAVLKVIITLFPSLLSKYHATIVWTLEFTMMDQVEKTGKTTNTLTTLFENMYFLPENFKTWIIGDGLYTTISGTPYMDTDPFYMRALLYFGAPGVIAFVLFMISIVRNQRIKENSICYGIDEKAKRLYDVFLIYVIILSLVIYVKLDAHCFWLVFYILWFWYFYREKQQKIGQS